MRSERSTTLSPCSALDRDEGHVGHVEARGEAAEVLARSRRTSSSYQSTRSILLTHTTRCGMPSSDAMKAWRRDCSRTPLRASTRTIDEVGGRGAGDHVARVAHVAGGVGDDERAPRRREVAVGDVDRDALLALGAQAVGEQREVDVAVAAPARDRLDVLELVGEDRLGVVEQAADQRRLAVVDRAGGGEAQQVVVACRPAGRTGCRWCPTSSSSEVALALAVLHRRLR